MHYGMDGMMEKPTVTMSLDFDELIALVMAHLQVAQTEIISQSGLRDKKDTIQSLCDHLAEATVYAEAAFRLLD